MKVDPKLQEWIDARKRHHLSHAHVQMARELGTNPRRFGSIDNHRQEPWKAPLPEFIEHLYEKRFHRSRPEEVLSIEAFAKRQAAKKAQKKAKKAERRAMAAADAALQSPPTTPLELQLPLSNPTGSGASVAQMHWDRAPITDFDRWVDGNTIPESYEFGKAWWDYVALIRRFCAKFEIADARVVGRYLIYTPPPEEELPMPAVALCHSGTTVALKWDFGKMRRWPLEWTASVRCRSPYRGPTLGLFDTGFDLRAERVDGLDPDWVFAPYHDNPAEFSCELEDEWDVATLLRFAFHEA